jgi:hypothetical protein
MAKDDNRVDRNQTHTHAHEQMNMRIAAMTLPMGL